MAEAEVINFAARLSETRRLEILDELLERTKRGVPFGARDQLLWAIIKAGDPPAGRAF